MKDTSHKILQVANRKTSVKLTVEFTKEIDNALDKVVESLPKMDRREGTCDKPTQGGLFFLISDFRF